ncbi:unnamed protein product [Rangifer tarandus platyrhynchus]|uniref:Uncharacterized protein n=2 Tax=Rangifer tarandus platyrhynchus TaxID=3082113 RepID=A0ACB0DPP2_RANTA|nr:unnamed protein product [Rangifer tarandus platyrhynchus]CAI9690229.1 unnamed protein product [Rangifer tarandus platyrhynchus]
MRPVRTRPPRGHAPVEDTPPRGHAPREDTPRQTSSASQVQGPYHLDLGCGVLTVTSLEPPSPPATAGPAARVCPYVLGQEWPAPCTFIWVPRPGGAASAHRAGGVHWGNLPGHPEEFLTSPRSRGDLIKPVKMAGPPRGWGPVQQLAATRVQTCLNLPVPSLRTPRLPVLSLDPSPFPPHSPVPPPPSLSR